MQLRSPNINSISSGNVDNSNDFYTYSIGKIIRLIKMLAIASVSIMPMMYYLLLESVFLLPILDDCINVDIIEDSMFYSSNNLSISTIINFILRLSLSVLVLSIVSTFNISINLELVLLKLNTVFKKILSSMVNWLNQIHSLLTTAIRYALLSAISFHTQSAQITRALLAIP